MDFLTLKPEAFGLDISDLSLKIVRLKKKKKGLSLASFGEREIKPGIIKGGEIKKEKILAKIIRESLFKVQGERIDTKYVVASLPEEKAFLEVIQMPKMALEDLRSAVIYAAENYIPLPIEKIYLDFQIIPPVYNHLDHYDILIAALPREIVDPYLISLKEAGLKPVAFEIESQAIARALIKDGQSSQPIVLIDMGATRTNLSVFSGSSLRFTSVIAVSSQHFTEIIAKNLDLDLAEAESLKIKYGLGERVKISVKDGFKKEIEKGQIFEALVPALVDFVQQIKKYLDYYQSHTSHEHLPPDGKGISKILLCGGGANLKGLCSFLSLQLKIPTELGNPWVNIFKTGERGTSLLPFEESLAYTTAIGLALRGIQKND